MLHVPFLDINKRKSENKLSSAWLASFDDSEASNLNSVREAIIINQTVKLGKLSKQGDGGGKNISKVLLSL